MTDTDALVERAEATFDELSRRLGNDQTETLGAMRNAGTHEFGGDSRPRILVQIGITGNGPVLPPLKRKASTYV